VNHNFAFTKEVTMEFPPPEVSKHILEFLKADTKAWVVRGYPTTAPPPQFSPIVQELMELEVLPEGVGRKEKENKIIKMINEKLQLAISIAEKLRPESYSVGVGFPFGISVSFTWPHTTKQQRGSITIK
jgi:hypothetical protein